MTLTLNNMIKKVSKFSQNFLKTLPSEGAEPVNFLVKVSVRNLFEGYVSHFIVMTPSLFLARSVPDSLKICRARIPLTAGSQVITEHATRLIFNLGET